MLIVSRFSDEPKTSAIYYGEIAEADPSMSRILGCDRGVFFPNCRPRVKEGLSPSHL
jgi:hypothetical protein